MAPKAKYVCPVCNGPKWSGGGRPCRQCDHIGSRKPRPCEVCGATYKPTHSLQRTCGRTCGDAIRRRAKRLSTAAPRSRVTWKQCAYCPAWYTTKGKKRCGCHAPPLPTELRFTPCQDCQQPAAYITRPVLRCMDCRKRHQAEVRRDHRKARKAKLRGAQVERVNVRKVYERDNWRCGLCHKRVNKNLKYPHPMSASLDHVLPLSLGGAHSMANVQLAHLICNHAKSNGGSQQLALVG